MGVWSLFDSALGFFVCLPSDRCGSEKLEGKQGYLIDSVLMNEWRQVKSVLSEITCEGETL